MVRHFFHWPRLIFISVPLLIVMVDTVVLVGESRQPDAEKAIRLLKESNSRKENFTIQQYLYMTVYHRKANGEPITVEGWRAATSGGSDALIDVEFSYGDSTGRYVAMWDANLKTGSVTAKNEAALGLSWH